MRHSLFRILRSERMICFLLAAWLLTPVARAENHYDAGYDGYTVSYPDTCTMLTINDLRVHNYQGDNSHFYNDPTVEVTVAGHSLPHIFHLSSLYSSIYFAGEGNEDPFKNQEWDDDCRTYCVDSNGITIMASFEDFKFDQTVTGNGNGNGSNKWSTADLVIRIYSYRKTTVRLYGLWRDYSDHVNTDNESYDWSFHFGYPYCKDVSASRWGETGQAEVSWSSSEAFVGGCYELWRDGRTYVGSLAATDTTTRFSYRDTAACGAMHSYTVTYRPEGKLFLSTTYRNYPELADSVTGIDLRHEFVNYLYNGDADCHHDGTRTGHCRFCGAAHSADDPEHPHWSIAVESIDPRFGSVTSTLSEDSCFVTLQAQAEVGYSFSRWNDGSTANPYRVEMTGPLTLTAYYKALLTVATNDSTFGSVTGSGYYECGSTISGVTAMCAANGRFLKWSDNTTSQTHIPFQIDSASTLIAYFKGDTVVLNKGIEDDCYEIGTAEELVEFAYRLNYIPKDSIENARLTADITLKDGYIWQPIESYAGVLDGQGHTIRGLRTAGGGNHIGLIGHLNGQVRQLGIADCSMMGDSYVGGLCGEVAANGVIQDCFVTGAVIGRHHAGGLYGACAGTVHNSYTPLTDPNDSAYRSQEQFAVGQVAWLLNGGTSAGLWGQDLSAEATPVRSDLGIRYSRPMASDWGTVVLPFGIEYEADNAQYGLFRMTSATLDSEGAQLHFEQYPSGPIAGGTPMLIRPMGPKDADGYRTMVLMATTDCTDTICPTTPISGFTMEGAFVPIVHTHGGYHIDGDEFVYVGSAISPAYYAWITGSLQGIPQHLKIVLDGASTGLTTPSTGECKTRKVLLDGYIYILRGDALYDIHGRFIQTVSDANGL